VTPAAGHLVHHLFAGRLVAEKGKIKLLRESLTAVAAAQVLKIPEPVLIAIDVVSPGFGPA